MPTNTELKNATATNIRAKTAVGSVTRANIADGLDAAYDYTDQQVGALSSRTDSLESKALLDKGYFATPAALTAAHPVGKVGDTAVVGSTDTLWIWDTDTITWKNSSAAVPASAAPVANTITPRQGIFADTRIVGFGSRVPFVSDNVSNGIDTMQTSRMRFFTVGATSDIVVHYSNSQVPGISGTNAAITLTASLEYPVGTFTKLTFAEGSSSYLLPWNGIIKTDVALVELPANTEFQIRTCVTVQTGQVWLKQYITNGGTEGAVIGSDMTLSGTIGGSIDFAFGPTVVAGVGTSRAYSVLELGDSIAVGQGDSGGANYKFSYDARGLFGRTFTNQFPNFACAKAGETLAHWLPVSRRVFSPFLSLCERFICELGRNDLNAGVDTTTLQTNYITVWDSLLMRGVVGYQTTITPQTTSTDNWATTTNQTPSSNNATRIALNDWFRDGAPLDVVSRVAASVGATGSTVIRAGQMGHPLLGFFDVADQVESARNSGLWKPGYSGDGTHATPTGYIAGSLAIDKTKFYRY
jgi:hypothetical protein